MPANRKPSVSAFTAALFSAVYTAWAAEIGFRLSNIWVLLAAALAATTTAYVIVPIVLGLRHLSNRSRRSAARE